MLFFLNIMCNFVSNRRLFWRRTTFPHLTLYQMDAGYLSVLKYRIQNHTYTYFFFFTDRHLAEQSLPRWQQLDAEHS